MYLECSKASKELKWQGQLPTDASFNWMPCIKVSLDRFTRNFVVIVWQFWRTQDWEECCIVLHQVLLRVEQAEEVLTEPMFIKHSTIACDTHQKDPATFFESRVHWLMKKLIWLWHPASCKYVLVGVPWIFWLLGSRSYESPSKHVNAATLAIFSCLFTCQPRVTNVFFKVHAHFCSFLSPFLVLLAGAGNFWKNWLHITYLNWTPFFIFSGS